MSQPTTTAPQYAAPQPPRTSGYPYLLTAAITGTAATVAWIGDMAIHHGVFLAAAIVAVIAGCAGVVRNHEMRMQHRIDEAREEGEAAGYLKGVDRALTSGSGGSTRLRSVT